MGNLSFEEFVRRLKEVENFHNVSSIGEDGELIHVPENFAKWYYLCSVVIKNWENEQVEKQRKTDEKRRFY